MTVRKPEGRAGLCDERVTLSSRDTLDDFSATAADGNEEILTHAGFAGMICDHGAKVRS